MNRNGAIIVLSFFAVIWWIVGASQLPRGSVLISAIGIVISGVFVAFDRRRGVQPATREERKRRGRIVGIASGVEGVAIVAAVNVLVRMGRRDLIAPAVAIIVGLHFLPLARWLPARIYYLTAALLVAVGLGGALVQAGPVRILAVGMGAAAILWLSCAVVLLRAQTERSQPASGTV
ncbi:MAG TPA: hypothetical protein VFY05_05700 [Candidatus Angelobacter sp.]|nr:hypothetical protein [Candidatus Angelobacter sp.]